MDVEIRNAPEGTRPYWRVEDETLIIWLAKDLDELARRRYVEQAKAENNIDTPRHRRRALPLVAASGIHRAAKAHSRTTAAVAGTAVASAAIAGVLVPLLDSHQTSARRHPPAYAAPAPRKPARPRSARQPHHSASTPLPTQTPDTQPPTPAGAGRVLPRLGVAPTLRGVARDTLRSVRPSLPLRDALPLPSPSTQTPAARRRLLKRVCVRVDLVVDARVGCGTLLSRGSP